MPGHRDRRTSYRWPNSLTTSCLTAARCMSPGTATGYRCVHPGGSPAFYARGVGCIMPKSRGTVVQDKQATKARQNMWQCGFCSKRFRTRGYLDAHFDRKHEHDADPVRLMCRLFVHGYHLTVLALQDAHDCFADLCPVVGCPSYNPSSDPHGLDRHALSFMCEVSQPIAFRCVSLIGGLTGVCHLLPCRSGDGAQVLPAVSSGSSEASWRYVHGGRWYST